MICLSGAQALSDFRLERLLRQTCVIEPSITRIDATYLYFVQHDAAAPNADGVEDARLLSILMASGPFVPAKNGLSINVVPRLGTRSPWSSKATDIVQRCGMHSIKRIERGIHFKLTGIEPGNPDGQTYLQIAALLHDRMTETLIDLPEQLNTLFASTDPAPLVSVNVLEDG